MGFGSFFKRAVTAVATGGFSEIGGASKAVTGVDITGGASKAVQRAGGALLVDAPVQILKNAGGAPPPAGTTAVIIPGQTQPIFQPINTQAPVPRGTSTGGTIAFGEFGLGGLGGGNPAWRSSGHSVTLFRGASQFSGRQGERWVSSGNSVRLS